MFGARNKTLAIYYLPILANISHSALSKRTALSDDTMSERGNQRVYNAGASQERVTQVLSLPFVRLMFPGFLLSLLRERRTLA